MQRACRAAGWDTRVVHPFATKSFRQPADLGNKTDDTDLAALFREHQTPMPQVLADLQTAVAQLPRAEHAAEARPLAEELERIETGHRRGPQPLATILSMVLARLGVVELQSQESGETDPR